MEVRATNWSITAKKYHDVDGLVTFSTMFTYEREVPFLFPHGVFVTEVDAADELSNDYHVHTCVCALCVCMCVCAPQF